jgi:opacity protein-like surface antigen
LSNTTFGKLIPLPNTSDVPKINVSLENLGASYGLSLGYMLTEQFELQGSFTYNRSEIINDVGIGLAGIPLGKTKVSSAKSLYYSANILYHFLINRISPFFTAGLGAVTLKTDKLRSRTKVLINFGAGVKFKLNRKLSIFLDFKDHVSFFNYHKDFDVIFAAIYAPDFKKIQHRLGINIGLSYYF